MNAVELYWIPLGAGGWFVRRNGTAYEWFAAKLSRREPQPLFHSALLVHVEGIRFAIELCPEAPGDHGRVTGGCVGSPLLGRLKVFRYEARCWRDGAIPDLDYAVGGPVVLSTDRQLAERIVDLVPVVPTPTWGRDELSTGEMWNSNSVVAWLIERADIDASSLVPPGNGRAPGWVAGVRAARRPD